MGYFANSAEGDAFESLFCRRCIHHTEPDEVKQCAVWMLHLSYNYDQHDEGMLELYPGFDVHGPTLKVLLDTLIVRDKVNGQTCSMFVARADARVTGGDVWCASFRHLQRIEDRNADAPCLLCMVENGVLHASEGQLGSLPC